MPLIKQDENDPSISYTIDTPEEAQAKIIAQTAVDAQLDKELQKNSIKSQLSEIDIKSIRAIRTNDTVRMAEFESQADALRAQLKLLEN